MTNTITVKQAIDKLVSFLTSHQNLSNCHMVDYFIKSLFKTCLPESLKNEILAVGLEKTIAVILYGENNCETPHLQKYIETCKGLALHNNLDICISRNEFFQSIGQSDYKGVKLNSFAKSKKAHEVEMLSVVAKSVKEMCGTTHLVDIGDGKGYLSSTISFQHNIPVLGVDGSLINTEGSMKRAKLLSKYWQRVTKQEKCEIDREKLRNYKQVTQLVTENTDFKELISNVFLEDPNGIGLIGLHTCGNLGPTSIRIFNKNPDIKSICNVSCCYHLLNENYLANAEMGSIPFQQEGFPMSDYVKSLNFSLLRAARMLSAQSIDRILFNKELPNKVIFYRAILECVLLEFYKTSGNVGKFRKEPDNFLMYAKESLKRLDLPLIVSDDQLQEVFERHKHQYDELVVFHLLRSFLAPAIESLILLDRMMYLKEQDDYNVFLVKLFDPVISPRCYGLIGMK